MITMKNVRKTYGTFQMDLSMEIPSGQITGLVGKNGAGKSTAIKLILGLTEAESGEISVFGKNIHQLSMTEKAQIGASLADSGFSTYLNIVDVQKILSKMYPDFDSAYFEKGCRELRLPEKKRIREYSTGMKAKLRVLTALSHHAKLLIMDEPTANLDYGNSCRVMERVKRLGQNGYTIIFSTHDPNQAFSYATKVLALKDGGVMAVGAPEAVLTEDVLSRLYGIPVARCEIETVFGRKTICMPVPGGMENA